MYSAVACYIIVGFGFVYVGCLSWSIFFEPKNNTERQENWFDIIHWMSELNAWVMSHLQARLFI